MSRVTLFAPAGLTGELQLPGENVTIPASGIVSVPATSLLDLLAAGFTFPGLGNAQARPALNGLVPVSLPLMQGRTVAGAVLAAAAAAGVFGFNSTPGTVLTLLGESAQNNTKTDVVMYEFQLPANYVAGEDLTVTINAGFSGSGTAGTKTVDASVYVIADTGAQGADLVSTNAQTIASTAADYAFVVNGDTLAPGARVLIRVTVVLQETGNANPLVAAIGSIRVG